MQKADNKNRYWTLRQAQGKPLGLSLWTSDSIPKSKAQSPKTTLPKVQSPKSKVYSAFTLAELLVAMLVLIIILGITGAIYKASNDAIIQNNATVSANTDVQATIRQIEQVLRGIYTNGYLVIYGLELNNNLVEQKPNGQTAFRSPNQIPLVRSDAMCFFTTGNFRSITNNGLSSNAGWVYLGHTNRITPVSYGTSPFDGSNPQVINRWVLSRYLLLLAPGITATAPNPAPVLPLADYRDWSIGGCTVFLVFQLAACATPGDVRNWFYGHWVYDYSYPIGAGWPNQAYWGTPPTVNFNTNPTFPYALSSCGNFKIEFAMPDSFDHAAGSNSRPQQTGIGGDIIWLDARSAQGRLHVDSTADVVNNGDVPCTTTNNDSMVVFGPNDVWPMYLRFTLRKYDDTLSITSEDTAGPTHAGTTVQYTFKLPPKR